MRRFLPLLALAAVLPFVDTLAQERKGRKVALLVAVQDYSDTGLTNLKHCENDIDKLAEVLRSQGYKDEDVIVLTDSAAAAKKKLRYAPQAENIRKELKGLVEDLRPEDTFLVAFSGHGAHLKALKEKGLHFCAKGTNLEKPETMVSLAEVYEQLEKHCKAELKLLFVDACRNDPTDGKAGTDGRLESLTRPLVPDPPGGTVAFFSCSTGQKSYESDKLGHGVFFYHVIEGLKGGPKDDPIARGGRVTVPLLEDYLSRAVPVAVKKDRDDRRLKQVPERKGTLRGEGVLAVVGGAPPTSALVQPPMPAPAKDRIVIETATSGYSDSDQQNEELDKKVIRVGTKATVLGRNEKNGMLFLKFEDGTTAWVREDCCTKTDK